jgi:hypothetical protein
MRAAIFVLAAALALTGCATVPAERILTFPEGTLLVTPDTAKIRAAYLATMPAAVRDLADATPLWTVCGFWNARTRTGMALPDPVVIAHERAHMLGVPHEAMSESTRHPDACR